MGVCFSCQFGEDTTLRHFTDEYKWNEPVFRRGLKCLISIPITGHADVYRSNSWIEIKAGVLNSHSIRIDDTSKSVEGWKVKYSSKGKSDKEIVLKVTSPVNAIVGQYTIGIHQANGTFVYRNFALFFNPWNKLDEVYMPIEGMLAEYIFNQNTVLYVGTTSTIENRPWILGQFEPDSIAATLFILDKIPADLRRSAKAVSRSLSALVNSNDDMGVLCGQWDGNYADGTSPTAWVNSVDILRKYVKTKFPVKYGQCWVFSGVLTTVARCCGIPCRSITNFESFHDNDGTNAWELYLDANMNTIEISSESVWNYHCWNEIWLMEAIREYSGWHVIDSTPQERSSGVYRLGPAPKFAIKNKILNAEYDVGFVHAEVNAKKIFHVQQPDGSFKRTMEKEGDIGKLIATKKMGVNEMEIITHEYKNPSHGEMRAVTDERPDRNKLATVEIACDSDLNVGNPFNLLVNFTEIKKAVKVRIMLTLVSYKGRQSEILHEVTKKITEDYKYSKAIDGNIISTKAGTELNTLKLMVLLMEEGLIISQEEKLINLKMPQIQILDVPSTVQIDTAIKAGVKIGNPFSYPLTNIKIYFNSDAMEKRKKVEMDELRPGESKTDFQEITFIRVGPTILNVSMDSSEGGGFHNTKNLKIRQ